jgi:hypothetical protein
VSAAEPPLRIEPLGPSEDTARLADYLWPGEQPDRALWRCADGDRWRVTSRIEPIDGVEVRTVVQSSLRGDGGATDRLTFHLTPDRFVELDPDGGVRIALPGVLERGVEHPFGGGAVHLAHAGPVRLLLGERTHRVAAIALTARVGDATHVQWLGRGVGELLIGPVGGPPLRWLVGWRGGDRALFGPVP